MKKKIVVLSLLIMLMFPLMSVNVKAEVTVTNYADLVSAISDEPYIKIDGAAFAWPMEAVTLSLPTTKSIELIGDWTIPANVTLNIEKNHSGFRPASGKSTIDVYGTVNASGDYVYDAYNLIFDIKSGGKFNVASEYYTWEPIVVENGGTLNVQGILGMRANTQANVLHKGLLEIASEAIVKTGSDPATSYIYGNDETYIRGKENARIQGTIATGNVGRFVVLGSLTVDNLVVDSNPLNVGNGASETADLKVLNTITGWQWIGVQNGSTLTYEGEVFDVDNIIDISQNASLIFGENVKTIKCTEDTITSTYVSDENGHTDFNMLAKIILLGTTNTDKVSRCNIPDKVNNDSSSNVLVIDDGGHHVYDLSDATRCIWCDGYALTQQTITVGASSYTKMVGDPNFNLNAKAKTELVYFSYNSDVCSVDQYTGNVTINGVGTATILIIANEENGYAEARKEVTVTVKPAGIDISKMAASISASAYTYTGSAIKPTVTVKTSSGTKLVSGTDYTVSYSSNTSVGNATITITGKGDYAGTKTLTFKIVPAKVAAVKTENTSSGIKVSWSAASGATRYLVYRSENGGSYAKVYSTTGRSYTDTSANVNGRKYAYKIYSYKVVDGVGYKGAGSDTKTYYFIKRPAMTSFTSTAATKAVVKWSANTKATGYQIQYSLKSDYSSGTKTVTVSSASTVAKTLTGLTSGKRYYVRMRAYKTVGSAKYYSAWTGSKYVTVK